MPARQSCCHRRAAVPRQRGALCWCAWVPAWPYLWHALQYLGQGSAEPSIGHALPQSVKRSLWQAAAAGSLCMQSAVACPRGSFAQEQQPAALRSRCRTSSGAAWLLNTNWLPKHMSAASQNNLVPSPCLCMPFLKPRPCSCPALTSSSRCLALQGSAGRSAVISARPSQQSGRGSWNGRQVVAVPRHGAARVGAAALHCSEGVAWRGCASSRAAQPSDRMESFAICWP